MVTASINGGRPASATGRNPFGSSRSGSASTPIPALHAHTTAGSPPAHTNGVKAEYQHGQSPALSAIRPTTAAGHLAPGSMPPPGVTSRPMSGSPHPQLQAPQLQAPLYQASANSYQPPQYHPPNGFTDNKNRPEGQSKSPPFHPSHQVKRLIYVNHSRSEFHPPLFNNNIAPRAPSPKTLQANYPRPPALHATKSDFHRAGIYALLPDRADAASSCYCARVQDFCDGERAAVERVY